MFCLDRGSNKREIGSWFGVAFRIRAAPSHPGSKSESQAFRNQMIGTCQDI